MPPLPANDNVPVLISMNDTVRLTSLSRTFLNKKRSAGAFPIAVPLGDRRFAFVRSEVVDWVKARIAARTIAANDNVASAPARRVA